nr:hypothetical protein BaRGS_008771 [Batillaria attramentaria]
MEYVFLHCKDEDLDFVFKTAMEQRLWRVVGALMHRPVTPELKEEAARKVITKTSRFTVVDYVAIFIPNCSRSSPLLECMLNEAVERDLWEVVGQLLEKRNVGDNKKKHAIRIACEYGTSLYRDRDSLRPYNDAQIGLTETEPS